MKQYETFIFDSYSFDPNEGKIELKYSLDEEVKFTETLTLPKEGLQEVPEDILDQALFALHLIGGTSYYKTCCPKKIEIRSGNLTKEQANFWNAVYENGLGEFFYQNQIDFRGLINFPITAEQLVTRNKKQETRNRKRILVPIGGGKDSIVTIELLKKSGADITLFRMGSHPLIEECAKVSGLPLLSIERQLSPTLFELNENDALNGHIPISAYLSCVTVVTALLYGFDTIAMSNERSASEGNVEYRGKEINHQWSKSLEFEQMFQEYVAKFITPDLKYFSFLRHLSELQIAKIFSEFYPYFTSFTSCNKNWRIIPQASDPVLYPRWCRKCPKCAFSFSLFAACPSIALPKVTLTKIFGANLYEDDSLLPLYKQLLGLEGCKPFECVGTPDETKAAFLLAHERGDLDDTPVMKLFLDKVLPAYAHT